MFELADKDFKGAIIKNCFTKQLTCLEQMKKNGKKEGRGGREGMKEGGKKER